ncbi:uncharacterized protein B0I36DRAFT_318512 [Microdochium trichocladiopsis]|uniref:18S rRNA factor 2 n=1 Tax=Microdochium trichocladiopsis TaxID=1682393 RepID=A0A9P8YBM5_9PEZI|nr:uncharacterized protein B0I36DRAFT_318512 [Microdochium trichocladiopsis]KAH7035513.1 hypothetical protein B0I36DRAFT_318512 [Microdochium trichocladiopsis]
MPSEKRNNFLDAGDSDDDNESQGYNSDADEVQKGGSRSVKRRRISEEPESDASGSDRELRSKQSKKPTQTSKRRRAGDDDDDDDDEEPRQAEDADDTITTITKTHDLPDITRASTGLTKKNLVATEKAVKKSGLIYISRVPPFMKPQKLRSLLEPYGTINRIFLSPEDPAEHTRRVKAGGNKKRSFTDGWVEFTNKNDAKTVVSMLNARTIGGPKGSYYRDDVWSMIYLKGFKWHNLTEQIASEAAERTSRIRAEITKATKENKDFVRNIERAKVLEGMEAKTAAKKSRAGEEDGEAVAASSRSGEKRKFKQAPAGKKGGEKAPEEAKRVLSKLF